MDLKDTIHFSYNSLCHQKTRTCLTVLGIVVGICSVIILVGLIQGLKSDVLEELEDFGPRTIVITPTTTSSGGGGFGPGSSFMPTSGKLFEKDYERVKRLAEIKSITKVIIGRSTITYKNESIDASVFGIEAGVFDDTMPLELKSGRFLEENERGVAGVGSDIADGFDEEIRTQSNIYLAGKKFRVIGVAKPTGSSFAPIDNVVFISFDDAKELFQESLLENEISAIRLTLKEGSNVTAAAEEVEDIMLASHRVTEDEKDFGVISPEFVNARFTEILDLITLFLGAIASISLIVGGIGIANTMFMSVLEKTREIGTMKAVGARKEQIRNIFLAESSMIGLLGGIMGLGLAVVIGLALAEFVELTFVFDYPVMAGALIFSLAVGLVSGTFPAMEAAKVDPMVALRYE